MKLSGFTLIELMIVMTIVGILSLTSIPFYEDYTLRARVSEGLSLAAAAELSVTENVVSGSNDLSLGWPGVTSTQNVQSVIVDPMDGHISITYTAQAKNIVLTLKPESPRGMPIQAGQVSISPIVWTCVVDSVANNRYVPNNCRI